MNLFRLLPITFVFAAVIGAAEASAQNDLVVFERDRLSVVTADGQEHAFIVELALSPRQQAQGMMFRQEMAADAGMLFVLKPAREVVMWMRNTYLPLDMLFIGNDGRIVKLVERTVPQSTTRIPSGEAVSGVLELNGGTAARLGIAVGDRVVYRAFKPAS